MRQAVRVGSLGTSSRWVVAVVAVGLVWGGAPPASGAAAVPALSSAAVPALSSAAVPALSSAAVPALSSAAVPAGADFAGIRAEQVQVVTRDYQAGVDQAGTALTGATMALTNARNTLDSATTDSATAAARAATATTTLAATTVHHQAAVVTHDMAVTTLATDRARLAQVALALYVGPPPTVPNVPDVPAAETAEDGQEYLDTSRQVVSADVRDDGRYEAAAALHERQLAAQVVHDRATLGSATLASQQAQVLVGTDTTTLESDLARNAAAQQALVAARRAQTTAVGALGPPAPDGSPTILGVPALTATQISGWYSSGYYVDGTAAPISALAGWYVSAGRAEGVRGDVAFAQAIVETGGFASPDAINLNNYAGIGHCDSCGAGLAFPTPQGGVTGHLQLLRVFASPAGTPLPQPAIIPAVAPGGEFRGACCVSWQSLTGRWATDPNYGQTVLDLYQSMLDYALSQPPVAPGAAPAMAPSAPGGR